MVVGNPAEDSINLFLTVTGYIKKYSDFLSGMIYKRPTPLRLYMVSIPIIKDKLPKCQTVKVNGGDEMVVAKIIT